MNNKEMTTLAIQALEEKKAEDIQIIDISEISAIADYFIIANGTNRSQIQALADSVEEKLGRAGVQFKQMEGYDTANWILMDFWILWFIFSTRTTGLFMTWRESGGMENRFRCPNLTFN